MRSPLSFLFLPSSEKLLLAAQKGNCDDVRTALRKRAQISYSDEKRRSALWHAVVHGYENIVSLLLDNDANPDQIDYIGTSPLFMAAWNGQVPILRLLIRATTSIDQADEKGTTPLLAAAKKGFPEATCLLLEAGADIDKKDEKGVTPLIASTWIGDLVTVRLLLENGAETEDSAIDGKTPLVTAVGNGDERIVYLLLSHGANPSRTNTAEGTCPFELAMVKKNFALAALLIEHGASLRNTTVGIIDLMSFAVKEGRDTLLSTIFKSGAVDPSQEEVATLFRSAVEMGSTVLARVFIDNGVAIESADRHSLPPLWTAVEKDDIEMEALLLSAGADVTVKRKVLGPALNETRDWTVFFVAVNNSNLQMVSLLILHGADVNQFDDLRNSPLSVAIFNADADVAVLLIDSGAQLRETSDEAPRGLWPDEDSNDLFAVATQTGNCELVRTLIESGVVPQSTTLDVTYACGLLSKSIAKGDVQMVNLLVEKGYDVNPHVFYRSKPLALAITNKDVDMVTALLHLGAAITGDELSLAVDIGCTAIFEELIGHHSLDEQTADLEVFTPALKKAVQEGNVEMATLLLEKGADVNADLERPLVNLAVSSQNYLMAQLLISRGANVNREEHDFLDLDKTCGSTPLYIAVSNDDVMFTRLLVEAGANLHHKNKGRSPVLSVAAKDGQVEMVQELLKMGADPNCRDSKVETALMAAVLNRQKEAVLLLLQNGAKLEDMCPRDVGPFLVLVEQMGDDEETMEIVLSKDIDINAANNDGETALTICARKGYINLAEKLITMGAKFDEENRVGNTPLMIAIFKEHSDIARLFIEKGANVHHRHKNGWTPIAIAAYCPSVSRERCRHQRSFL